MVDRGEHGKNVLLAMLATHSVSPLPAYGPK